MLLSRIGCSLHSSMSKFSPVSTLKPRLLMAIAATAIQPWLGISSLLAQEAIDSFNAPESLFPDPSPSYVAPPTNQLDTTIYPPSRQPVQVDLCKNNPTVKSVETESTTSSQPIAGDLVAGLEPTLSNWMVKVEPEIIAQLSAQPYPQLHERAKMSKVPILMYHDILPEKEVFFDVTPEEFEAHLQYMQQQGVTPISAKQLMDHLTKGFPLPEKPVLLTFDDGYAGHYQYVYPLLKQYNVPAVFSIYTSKIGKNIGRSSVTWEQLRTMAADPLVTIASHSVTHPEDLRGLPANRLRYEIVESKRILEENLGISIDYFTYPVGKYDDDVQYWTGLAGYNAAFTMNDDEDRFAGESETLLSVERIGQSALVEAIAQAWGGPPMPSLSRSFNFSQPIQLNQVENEEVPLTLISGGKPFTIHADSRYQVEEIIAGTPAVAAVDGGFFSLKYLDSNTMIGPVFSQATGIFVPGDPTENLKLAGRPLIVITPNQVDFIPFDPNQHNSLEGIQAAYPDITDAFVGAAFLVRNSQPQPPEAFGDLFDFDAERHRAFWGIDQSGQPVLGVSVEPVGSVMLGEILSRLGFRDAVMLDSGASTSLAYQGESLVGYVPRPVPHVVALLPPELATTNTSCLLASLRQATNQAYDSSGLLVNE